MKIKKYKILQIKIKIKNKQNKIIKLNKIIKIKNCDYDYYFIILYNN
jgi:hypothetical protein